MTQPLWNHQIHSLSNSSLYLIGEIAVYIVFYTSVYIYSNPNFREMYINCFVLILCVYWLSILSTSLPIEFVMKSLQIMVLAVMFLANC